MTASTPEAKPPMEKTKKTPTSSPVQVQEPRDWKALGIISALIFSALAVFAKIAMDAPLFVPGKLSESDKGPPTDWSLIDDGSNFWVTRDGVRIFHETHGNGDTPVLVLHGGPGRPFVKPITFPDDAMRELKFHYVHARGCGRSSRPVTRIPEGTTSFWGRSIFLDRHLGVRTQVADIERIRRKLGVKRLLIIGHSWGGFVATMYAAEFPKHVAGLVLSSPADVLQLPNPHRDRDLFAVLAKRIQQKAPERLDDWTAFQARYWDIATVVGQSEAEVRNLNRQFVEFFAIADPSVVEDGYDEAWTGGLMVFAQYLSLGRRHDYRIALSRITCPTLIVHGSQDLIPVDASRQYRDLIKSAQLRVLKDATHCPWLTGDGKFALHATRFFRQVVADDDFDDTRRPPPPQSGVRTTHPRFARDV